MGKSTPSLGITQPQGKEQRDFCAGGAQGSGGSPMGAGWPQCFDRTDRQTADRVLAGITTSSRQQELGWAGHSGLRQSQLGTEEAIMMSLSVPHAV